MIAAAVVAAPAGAASPVGSVQFRTVDVPPSLGSPWDLPGSTEVTEVNNSGTLVGTWQGVAGDQHGFIEQPGGQTISFDALGSSCCTVATGINDKGTVVGHLCSCGPGPFLFNGWVRSPDGSFKELDDPLGPDQTTLNGINDRGEIVGSYSDASGVGHGFFYDRGKFTTIDVPGASFTAATAINNSGTIVGAYGTDYGLAGGFRYQNGKFS